MMEKILMPRASFLCLFACLFRLVCFGLCLGRGCFCFCLFVVVWVVCFLFLFFRSLCFVCSFGSTQERTVTLGPRGYSGVSALSLGTVEPEDRAAVSYRPSTSECNMGNKTGAAPPAIEPRLRGHANRPGRGHSCGTRTQVRSGTHSSQSQVCWCPSWVHPWKYGIREGEGVRFPLHMTSRSPSNPYCRDHGDVLLPVGSEKKGHSAPVKRRQIRLPRTTVPRKPLKQAKKTSTKGRGRRECPRLGREPEFGWKEARHEYPVTSPATEVQ